LSRQGQKERSHRTGWKPMLLSSIGDLVLASGQAYLHSRYLMKTRLQKWGNSLAVRVPSSFAKDAQIEDGSEVEISVVQGKLIVTPLIKRYSLDQLLSAISKKNLYSEIDTGKPIGKEIW
jgi:antitoxin MazE